jgi:hypothetical protein
VRAGRVSASRERVGAPTVTTMVAPAARRNALRLSDSPFSAALTTNDPVRLGPQGEAVSNLHARMIAAVRP